MNPMIITSHKLLVASRYGQMESITPVLIPELSLLVTSTIITATQPRLPHIVVSSGQCKVCDFWDFIDTSSLNHIGLSVSYQCVIKIYKGKPLELEQKSRWCFCGSHSLRC